MWPHAHDSPWRHASICGSARGALSRPSAGGAPWPAPARKRQASRSLRSSRWGWCNEMNSRPRASFAASGGPAQDHPMTGPRIACLDRAPRLGPTLPAVEKSRLARRRRIEAAGAPMCGSEPGQPTHSPFSGRRPHPCPSLLGPAARIREHVTPSLSTSCPPASSRGVWARARLAALLLRGGRP